MKKALLACLLFCSTSQAAVVVYKISTNELVAVGDINPKQFADPDFAFEKISDDNAKIISGDLKLYIFNPSARIVELRPTSEQADIKDARETQEDLRVLIGLQAHWMASIDLAAGITNPKILIELAAQTAALKKSIDEIILRLEKK